MMKKILVVTAIAVLFASCKGKNAVPDQTLLNTRWILETIGSEKVDNKNKDRPIFLFMEDGSHQLTGFAGCNNFFGSFLTGNADELMFVGARPQLLNTRWILEAIGDERIDNSSMENPIYIELTQTDSSNVVAGMAGCNRYFGMFNESGDSLSFDKLGVTRMLCDHMETEDKYLKALDGVDSYQVEGLYLYLKSNGTTVLTYRVAEESIQFAVASTLMACDNMEVENKLLKTIGDVRKYDIDGLNLHLMNADGTRILGFKASYEE